MNYNLTGYPIGPHKEACISTTTRPATYRHVSSPECSVMKHPVYTLSDENEKVEKNKKKIGKKKEIGKER